MSNLLRTRPSATPAMLAVWDDAAVIGHALAFEAALARAQAAEGLIVPGIADEIERVCSTIAVDPTGLAEEVALAGTLAIPLVRRLREAVGDDVHLAATSQDVADTVMMMQVRAASVLVLADVERIAAALRPLAERHSVTPALGRTLMQDAAPIGFGLRIAHWHAGIVDAGRQLDEAVTTHALLQLGGAAGTRAGMGGKGMAVAACLAAELRLEAAPPWHARRGGVALIAATLAILIGACAKMARDVSLLSQNAIGEAREPIFTGRGGSSTMAHKRNPTGCQVALSAAMRAPGLVAGVLAAIPAEQERGLGGWQAEGPMLADLFLLAAGATDAMATVAKGIEIEMAAIARNLATAGLGEDIGESVMLVEDLLVRGN